MRAWKTPGAKKKLFPDFPSLPKAWPRALPGAQGSDSLGIPAPFRAPEGTKGMLGMGHEVGIPGKEQGVIPAPAWKNKSKKPPEQSLSKGLFQGFCGISHLWPLSPLAFPEEFSAPAASQKKNTKKKKTRPCPGI